MCSTQICGAAPRRVCETSEYPLTETWLEARTSDNLLDENLTSEDLLEENLTSENLTSGDLTSEDLSHLRWPDDEIRPTSSSSRTACSGPRTEEPRALRRRNSGAVITLVKSVLHGDAQKLRTPRGQPATGSRACAGSRGAPNIISPG